MEETRKLTIPDGYEFDRVEGGEVILKKKEVELPKTWSDCHFIIEAKYLNFTKRENAVPVELFNPTLALCELLICRNAWWKQLGWKPDWTDGKEPFKWCIHSRKGMIEITSHSWFSRTLTFPTREIAAEFLEAFRDLIEEAKELL